MEPAGGALAMALPDRSRVGAALPLSVALPGSASLQTALAWQPCMRTAPATPDASVRAGVEGALNSVHSSMLTQQSVEAHVVVSQKTLRLALSL